MASKVFRNGTALFKVLEDAPFDLVASFCDQPDEHFAVVRDPSAGVMSLPDDDPKKRSELLGLFASLSHENTKPIELECQRIVEVSEKSGPASLLTIARQRIPENQYEVFERQVDPLCMSAFSAHGTVWRDSVAEGLRLIFTPIGAEDDKETRDDQGPG